MRPSAILIATVGLAALTAACADPTASAPRAELVVATDTIRPTDRRPEGSSLRFDIVATLRNTTHRPIVVPDCGGDRLEELRDGEWRHAFSYACAVVSNADEPLAPGQTRELRFRVELSRRSAGGDTLYGRAALPGRYRYVVSFRGWTDEAVVSTASNPFTLIDAAN